jgi:ADP-heptose:LPS heptosyltransferase
MNSFQETLGFIQNLDFVITSCTSIAHLAAASGKKVFVMVPISAYYVWSHSGDKSPWYGDNVTLLRQEKPRCWKAPLEKLKSILSSDGLMKK